MVEEQILPDILSSSAAILAGLRNVSGSRVCTRTVKGRGYL